MQPVELHSSPAKSGFMLAGCIAFVIGSFLMIEHGSDTLVIGLLSLVFFGFALVKIVQRFGEKGPQVIIDDRGVYDKRSIGFVIPWSQIRFVGVTKQFIGLQLLDEQPYLDQYTPAKRFFAQLNTYLGYPHFVVNLAGLEGNAKDIAVLIDTEARRHA